MGKNETAFSSCGNFSFIVLHVIITPNLYSSFTTILSAVLAPITTLANLVIIVTITRTRWLHSPSNALICCLAITDALVGCITESLLVVSKLNLEHKIACVSISSGILLGVVGFLTYTLVAISVDRWLALHLHLRYQELVTIRRMCIVYMSFWIFGSVPVFIAGMLYIRVLSNILMIGGTLGILVIGWTYIKIFQIVRRHHVLIHSQGQVSSDVSSILRHKKSVINTLCILVLFICCYLPFVSSVIARFAYTVRNSISDGAFRISIMVVLLNSFFNPLVYFLRMRDVRRGVVKTLKDLKTFCCG